MRIEIETRMKIEMYNRKSKDESLKSKKKEKLIKIIVCKVVNRK